MPSMTTTDPGREDRRPASYLAPYDDALRAFGPGFRATLWGTEAAQVLRFDVQIDLAARPGDPGGLEGEVLVDVGCGRGDLCARLTERRIPYGRFIGLDAMAPMIEDARGRGLPRAEFQVVDLLDDPRPLDSAEADVAFVSGTLNTMDTAAARHLVRRCFDATARGVVFNLLSSRPHPRWQDKPLGPAHRFDVVSWLEWCLGLTSRVEFTQSYLDGHDATFAMWHDGQR